MNPQKAFKKKDTPHKSYYLGFNKKNDKVNNERTIMKKSGNATDLIPGPSALKFNTFPRIKHIKKESSAPECFFCKEKSEVFECPWCRGVHTCSRHSDVHRKKSKCFPFRLKHFPIKGRGLVASRYIRKGDTVLLDTAALVGPGVITTPVCCSCLAPAKPSNPRFCSKCSLPVCDTTCEESAVHQEECKLLVDNKVRVKIEDYNQPVPLLSFITPYRLLMLKENDQSAWDRVASLKDHLQERVGLVEFDMFQKDVVQFLRRRCFLSSKLTEEEIHRAIGIIMVNSVSLEPRRLFAGPPKGLQGKGIFPIFALLNHSCVSNCKFRIDIQDDGTPLVRVTARRDIEEDEEITVQYYSSLLGTHKRRRRIRSEWYFSCECARCRDKTELGTMVSAVVCEACESGYLLPRNPLDELEDWSCSNCEFFLEVPDLELKIDQLEEDVNLLSSRRDTEKLRRFIDEVSGSILHPNHYLILLAERNLDYIIRKNLINKMATDGSLWSVKPGSSNQNSSFRTVRSNGTCNRDKSDQSEEKIYQIISKILMCDDK
ncbi:protein msta isoform X2 [Eurytemora carolleeae]|nr:protein msta isoform X2 [Eurytemora carolleeae]|eukprot:XP_023346084.1 protein msta-like isoform X2 [Eurytemora affinis]